MGVVVLRREEQEEGRTMCAQTAITGVRSERSRRTMMGQNLGEAGGLQEAVVMVHSLVVVFLLLFYLFEFF